MCNVFETYTPHMQILPYKVKMQYVHFRLHANYFLLPWKICEESCIQSRFFNNLKAVATILNIMYIQPFTMGVDWPEIRRLMEVSIMFNICTYWIFTWYRRIIVNVRKTILGIRANKTYLTLSSLSLPQIISNIQNNNFITL